MADGLVLIIEDDRARRYVAGRLLREAGYEVVECGTGGEGLRLARARRPDLVLLDVMLPDLDGREVCRHLKSDPATSAAVVLHLSAAYTTTADAVTGLDSGADGYLTYPVEPAYLIATVRAFMRARRAEKRVSEEMRSANETLERRVAERTAQLRDVVAEMGRTEQRERHRVAADLHDNLAQLMAACKMKASAIAASASDGTRLKREASEVSEMLGEVIEYTRSLMSELSPAVLDDEDLDLAVAGAAERAEKQGLKVRVETDGLPKPVDDPVRWLLLQGVRELLHNVAKHAEADEAVVSLRRVGDEVTVCVADRGRGCEEESRPGVPTQKGGFGLFSLRERLRLLGGRMEVESGPGRGTTVRLTAPLRVRQ